MAAPVAPLTSNSTVAVTGASGFLASELVAQLLARGVRVRGTVRSLADATRVAHLRALPGAAELLTLFEADLLANTAGFAPAFAGASVVFHTACPFVVTAKAVALGEEFFVEPAVKGTVAVLAAAAAAGCVARVVLTSSTAAILKRLVEPGHVYNEDDWNDVAELAERKMYYSIAKTKQERAAWAWMEEHKPAFSLVSINPTMIAGPARQPTLNASLENVKSLADGSSPTVANINMPWVHVADVAEAHILAAEKPAASGRYMMISAWRPMTEAAAVVAAMALPGLVVPTALADGQAPAPLCAFDSSRVERELLGRPLRGLAESLEDSVRSLVRLGHLPSA
jgi:cinnamoyl-CoA reductase